MNTKRYVITLAAALAMGFAPAVALASGHGKSGTAPGHSTTTTAVRGNGAAKAYGKYCKGESKKHVAGQKGTPFSQCVTA
ncbi:MAG: hypothetical protein ACP5H2_00750, partial [Solirubrobacteraceae bacterium]